MIRLADGWIEESLRNCVPVKYLTVLRQASTALRNTKLAGLQATRVIPHEREKLSEEEGQTHWRDI